MAKLSLCSACGAVVSRTSPACPSCGHPLRRPTMAESFLLGGLAPLAGLLGWVALIPAFYGFAQHGAAGPVFLVVAIALMGVGAYLRYVARHSVRVTR